MQRCTLRLRTCDCRIFSAMEEAYTAVWLECVGSNGEATTCCTNISPTSSRLFFFSSRRRHTRFDCDWSSDVCSSDLSCLRLSRPLRRGGVDHRLWRATAARQSEAGLVCAERFRSRVRRRPLFDRQRSEERRVGKECRSRWSPYH